MELRPKQFYVFAAFFPLLLASSSALFLGLPTAVVVAIGGFLSLLGLGSLAYAILMEFAEDADLYGRLPLWYAGLLVLYCINLFAFAAMSPGSLVDALRTSVMGYLGIQPTLPQAIVGALVNILVIAKIIHTF